MIRVIIERHCQPGKEAEMESLFVDLRAIAMRQHGYVSGETLQSIDDPSFWLVISTWISTDLWKVWHSSAERRELLGKIEPLLVAPEKISVFGFIRRGGAESAHRIDR